MNISNEVYKQFSIDVNAEPTSSNSNRKIIYLVNPKSGTSKKDAVIDLIKKETDAQKINYEILHTNAAGNYDFIIDKIEHEQITDIVMIGGDGTVNTVTKALNQCNVNFGIIPMGSGNGLARAAHISTKPKAALANIFTGKATYIDAFKINNHYSCMLSGLGFDAQVAHDFSTKASRGLLTYTQQSILNFFKAQPYQFEVIIDNFKFFTEAFFISIANSNQFGNNFTIAPKAKLSDGLLDIVIVQKMSKAKLPFAILQQLRGNNKLQDIVEDITNKNVIYFQTPSLKIINNKIAPLHIDGEPVDSFSEMQIEILPKCFRLIH